MSSILNANEQYLLELINRARLDPAAEAQRYGLADLSRGFAPGSITAAAKQVLAPNQYLNISADNHSQWMLDTDTFSHTGVNGSRPGERMAAAGYPSFGTWGENLSWLGHTGGINLANEIEPHHRQLFLSDSHRGGLLDPGLREVGLGQLRGEFIYQGVTYDASMLTQNFATSAGSPAFVTGVAYTDSNANRFYNIGEAAGATEVSSSLGGSATTVASGGYSLAVAYGNHRITFGSAQVDVAITGENVKIDLINGNEIATSGSLSLVSGVQRAMLLGVAHLSLTGGSAAETLVGNKGNNTLSGGAGNDTLDGGAGSDTAVFFGAFSGYTISYSQITYSFTVSGSSTGTDTVSNVEFFQFGDGIRSAQDFIGADPTPPTLVSLNPNDNALSVPVGANLVLTFSEAVQAGSGNIEIRHTNGSVVHSIAVTDASQVSFSGATVTINPATDLAVNTGYYVLIGAGAIRDLAGNPYAGIAGTTTYNFTTALSSDVTPPTVLITDNIAGTASGNVTYNLAFSEAVSGLAANDFTLVNGSVVSVTGSGANYSVVVAPSANTEGSLALTLKAGAVQDAAGNQNAATSAAAQPYDVRPPVVSWFDPDDESTNVNPDRNIMVSFNEPIQRGAGSIVLRADGGAVFATYDAATSANLSISGNTLIINPSADLAYGTTYRLEIPAGAIRDLAGASFGGTSSLNFTTWAPDTTVPTVLITDNVGGTAVGNVTYNLTFSEDVIGLAADDFTLVNGSVVNVTGSRANYSVVVAPSANTEGSLALTLKAGAVQDGAGNQNAAVSAAAQLVDTRVPAAIGFSPADNASSAGVATNIVVTFSESVQRGAGSIVLRVDGGATVATYDAATSANLSISGNTLTINPSADLAYGTAYKVEFAAGTIRDLAGNPYAGTTSYNFTTSSQPGLVLVGTPDADTLSGSGGADTISGLGGDDFIFGAAGDDSIDAGAGYDTSVWSKSAANYALGFSGDTLMISDLGGADGVDSLRNVEALRFSDKNVIVESRSHGTYADLPIELYHFFIVAFNAAPGVEYMDQLAEAWRHWGSVKPVVDAFTTKTQFTDVYPASLSHEALGLELSSQIIKNSATAQAKAEAARDIKAALDHGWSVGDVIYTVFGNLANKPLADPTWGNTAKQFANQIEVAKVYTDTLNQSTTDLQTLRDVLAPVTPYTDVSSQNVIVTLIGQALLDGGTALV